MPITRSVRDFVLPLEPRGSLDASLGLMLEEDAALQGTRLHARIQKRLAETHPDLQAERPLMVTFERDDFTCLVRGRLDVLIPGDPPLVEEIKTSYQPKPILRALAADPTHPFAQQARMYAWIHGQQTGTRPTCRLRIVSQLDESETLVEVPFDMEAFGLWVEAQVDALHAEHLRSLARAAERRVTGEALAFPFDPPRPGQTRLMSRVAEALAGSGRLLLQAPTGLGKTAAVLHPGLARALAEDLRVFYLTPRNSQHAVAEAYVRRLREAGHPVRSITLRAKERICPQDEVLCHPDACPRALGYYDRLKASGAISALMDLGCADPVAVSDLADRHVLCPFELALDAARHADVIIGDYNYALAPGSTLARFFGTPEQGARNLLLLDEAHNLPGRARDWFSPALDLGELEALRKLWKGKKTGSLRAGFLRQLDRCLRLVGEHAGAARRLDTDPARFSAEEQRLRALVAKAGETGAGLPPSHPLMVLFRLWSDFTALLREGGEALPLTWIPPGRLQITCLDAAPHLAERFEGVAGAVLFSATLKPFDFYARLSGLPGVPSDEEASPFPAAHRKVILVPQVSSRLRLRERETPRIAQVLNRVLPLKPGNYVVFFPSFDFLEKTLPHVDLPGFEVLAQPRRAAASDLDALLEALRLRRGVVLFAVQGGSLSEGVDLPGEALIGAVIVGPPLPPFDLERRLAQAFFDRQGLPGEAYTCTYPAMAKAIQAAGRVIRGPEDRGLLLFLDNRFLDPAYAPCFPADWFAEGPREAVSKAILADVAAFWANAATQAPGCGSPPDVGLLLASPDA